MSDVFILKNQFGQYYSKSGEWISEGDTKTLFRAHFPDEIINVRVEISVKDPSVRAECITVEADPKGNLNIADLPRTSTKHQEQPQHNDSDIAESP